MQSGTPSQSGSSAQHGTLYIVATPIGNLLDISQRALEVLRGVDRIACEDTRHSGRLLSHYRIQKPTLSLHEHNERERAPALVAMLERGESIALISDAGTPLISDPGYPLVNAVRSAGLPVVPLPGPSAVITALCASGLPSDRFSFEGFLPAKSTQRQLALELLAHDPRTLIFYESPRRLQECLAQMAQVFGEQRQACLARELTKTFETFHTATLAELCDTVDADQNQRKGEIVLLIAGWRAPSGDAISPEAEQVLKLLLEELPLKKAAAIAAKLTGVKKNKLYQHGLEL